MKFFLLICALFALLSIAFVVKADESASSPDVIELNGKTFDKTVLNSDAVWLVAFIAPWC